MPPRLSVILPARNEQFLTPTVNDLLAKATGPIEVIAVLDGAPPVTPLPDDPRVRVIAWAHSKGLREAVNAGMEAARGEFVMKLDAHCMVEEGFDEILTDECEPNWLMIPRRVSLDTDTWSVAQTGRAPVDYEFMGYPLIDLHDATRCANVWAARRRARIDVPIDDNMSFQGSCYVLRKAYWSYLGPLCSEGWGTFVLEPEELSNKVWLSGGRVVTNKKTQYAHLHKGKRFGRGYFIDTRNLKRGREHNARFWLSNSWRPDWPTQVHPFPWLIDHFWPVPFWPANWQEEARAYLGSFRTGGTEAGTVAAGSDQLISE